MSILQVLSSISCEFTSLTGAIPFNGTSYKQIVLKNMKGLINFDFSKYNIGPVAPDSELTSHGLVKSNA